ncbi:hypothetical protein LTR37_018877 [Vermiconidia calcicola]|uniref:Uncharacterized protein n=1 Tax=Vermiconidia calcicola TaxID=1690605 RepID=A0ACC3MFU2_9PEZI|nr:hypothetical protein LTR37_018877 [Vermiconidia calcicola]
MPIIRNPFRKQDENARPATSGVDKAANGTPAQPISIKEKDQVEYKLSEINDSGVFVPPSPPERKSFWTTSSSRSTTSSKRPSLLNDNEPFNISRESFDSYRRSFDISARSPVIQPDTRPRASLDSRTFLPPAPRSSNSFHRPLQVPGTQKEEESDALEDVALDDPKPQQPPKKRGMFSRILDSDSNSERPSNPHDGISKGSPWHHFGGRKRGQSGQGAELGSIPKVVEQSTKPAESQLRKEESAVQKPVENQAKRSDPNVQKSPESQRHRGESNVQKPQEVQVKDGLQPQISATPKLPEAQPRREEANPHATAGAENAQAPVTTVRPE